MADQRLLVRKAEPPGRRTARNDERLGVNRLLTHGEGERAIAEIGFDDVSSAIFGAKTRGLLAHVLDEFGALNAFRKPRKVFDERGERKLSAGFMSFDDKWLQIGARAVKGGGVSGTSGTDDDDVASIHSGQ